jgi:tetratricopeptide (TPR) repeat protein/O-antigen ligase
LGFSQAGLSAWLNFFARAIVFTLINIINMTFNRALLYTIIGSLFAVLFIPLFVNNSLFFPFITGKNFAFRIIVEIAGLCYIILMLRDKTYRPKLSYILASIFAFVLIVGVANVFSSNPVKSFLSNFERMEGWITLAHLALYFILLISVLPTWKYWRSFLQTSVGVSVIVCIHGFMQLSGAAAIHQSTSRLDASFGNATYLAVYMLFHIFITAILLARYRKDSKVKYSTDAPVWYADIVVWTYALIILFQTIVLFYTATRGSILGLIGGFIVAAFLLAFTERDNKVLRNISFSIIVTLTVLVALFITFRSSDFIKNNEVLGRLASISATDNTTKARFMIWNMAYEGVTQDSKHFMVGWGQESFNYLFSTYYNPGMYGQEQWFDRSHNVFFDWLTAAGFLGLLAYLSMFGFTVWTIWRKSNFSNLEKSLITGMLAGYFFHNLFVFDNIVSYIMFFTILAYVHANIRVADAFAASVDRRNNKEPELSPGLQYSGIILATIIFIGVFYQYNYKAIAANTDLIRALTQTRIVAADNSSSLAYTKANVDAFNRVIAYNTIGLYEAREQLLDVAQKSLGNNTEASVRAELVNLAKTEIGRQLQETPEDVRYYVLGGSFYQNIGDVANAEKLLTKAAQLSPNKQSLLFVLGSNYFAQNKAAEALAVFKKAYELDTEFTEAKTLYGLVALYLGQDKITNDLLGPGPIMDQRFLAAYKSIKKYDLMIAYLEKNVEQKSGDVQAQVQAHVALAAGYMTVGNKTKAITTLQNIKKITSDATIATQIDSLIKDIKAGKNPLEPKN